MVPVPYIDGTATLDEGTKIWHHVLSQLYILILRTFAIRVFMFHNIHWCTKLMHTGANQFYWKSPPITFWPRFKWLSKSTEGAALWIRTPYGARTTTGRRVLISSVASISFRRLAFGMAATLLREATLFAFWPLKTGWRATRVNLSCALYLFHAPLKHQVHTHVRLCILHISSYTLDVGHRYPRRGYQNRDFAQFPELTAITKEC